MCDYSLQHVAHRPATVGDKLVSARFRNSTTHGFMAAGEPEVAICVLPGTELAFDSDVEYRPQFLSFRNRKLTERVARFRNVNQHDPYSYHRSEEHTSELQSRLHLVCRLLLE